MSDEMTDAQKLLHLADWLDLRFPDRPGEDEVRRDLRRIAAALAAAERERDVMTSVRDGLRAEVGRVADLLASFLWAEGVDAEKRGLLLRTINRMRAP